MDVIRRHRRYVAAAPSRAPMQRFGEALVEVKDSDTVRADNWRGLCAVKQAWHLRDWVPRSRVCVSKPALAPLGAARTGVIAR
jgi:hypothetical protein